MLGAMFFLKKIREYARLAFPLFLISFASFSEYMIRQAFGYSFVFLFIAFMFSDMPNLKKWVCMALCFWMAYNIHSANAITCAISVGLYYFVSFPIKPIYTIPLYLVASFYLQKHFDFSYLNGVLSFLGDQSDKFSSYTDNAENWFSDDAKNAIYDRKPFIKILQTMGDCSLMYLSYICIKLKPNRQFSFFHNTFAIGAIVTQCFYSLEILRRMGDVMYWYWAFPLAYYLFHAKYVFKQFATKKFMLKCLSLALLFYSYDYLKYLFMRVNDMYKFLWDM